MVKPITPEDVADEKLKYLPETVIDTWNRMIAQKWNGKCAVINQKEIIKALAAHNAVSDLTVWDLGWLEIEDIYRKAGWVVIYDKPAYYENYDATFEFTKKR